MTLKQAQKQYDDALQMKCEHLPFSMTVDRMTEIGEYLRGKENPSKVLFVKVGKCISTVISSREAFLEQQQNTTSSPGDDETEYQSLNN
jgi:hypothetical protein